MPNKLKGLIFIIEITKAEAKVIRAKYPKVYIAVTNKFAPARKKTYYMEEQRFAVSEIQKFRKRGIVFD